MRRRDFIKGIAVSTTWPLAARAQQPPLPVVALVNLRSAEGSVRLANAFRKGLNEAGWVDGQNVTVDYNWLDAGRYVYKPPEGLPRFRIILMITPGFITCANMPTGWHAQRTPFAVDCNPVTTDCRFDSSCPIRREGPRDRRFYLSALPPPPPSRQ